MLKVHFIKKPFSIKNLFRRVLLALQAAPLLGLRCLPRQGWARSARPGGGRPRPSCRAEVPTGRGRAWVFKAAGEVAVVVAGACAPTCVCPQHSVVPQWLSWC